MVELPMHISSKWLYDKGFIPSQYHAFCANWPDGMEMTVGNLESLSSIKLILEWFTRKIFPRELLTQCEAGLFLIDTSYKEELDPIESVFLKRLTIVVDEYHSKLNPILDKSEAASAPFWREYLSKSDELWDNFKVVSKEYCSQQSVMNTKYKSKKDPSWYKIKGLLKDCSRQDDELKAEYQSKTKASWREYISKLTPIKRKYKAARAALYSEYTPKNESITNAYLVKRNSFLVSVITEYYKDRGYAL